jgi:hypothetical protein
VRIDWKRMGKRCYSETMGNYFNAFESVELYISFGKQREEKTVNIGRKKPE